MTISLAENAAVTNPKVVLPRRQQQALTAIATYKRNRMRAGSWEIGDERFSPSVIEALKARRLARERKDTFGPVLSLTTAGQLAADRLKEARQ